MKIWTIFFAILIVLSDCQFSTTPNQNFYTGQSWGTATKISPDNNFIIVGYRSGNLAIYKTNGDYFTSLYGYHTNQIVSILWPKGYGPVTIDRNGGVIRWTTSFGYYTGRNLGGQVYDAAFVSNGNEYIAFNLGNRIIQYDFQSLSVQTNLYNAPNGQNYTALQYSTGRAYLYTGLSNSTGIIYNAGSGTQFYRFTTYYQLKKLQLIDDNYLAIGLDSNDYFYQINYYGVLTYLGSTSSMQTFSYCDSTSHYVVAYLSFSEVDVYNKNSGSYQQYLYYFNYPARGLDCSNTYLVSIDDYGYLTINSYSGFPGWAIGLIVGVAVIIIIVIVTIVIVRKKRMARMAGINGYNNMDNQSSNPYFGNQGFNNQGFNNNQGFKNNQGFNNNGLNNPYSQTSNQYNNPYQANQPRNWS